MLMSLVKCLLTNKIAPKTPFCFSISRWEMHSSASRNCGKAKKYIRSRKWSARATGHNSCWDGWSKALHHKSIFPLHIGFHFNSSKAVSLTKIPTAEQTKRPHPTEKNFPLPPDDSNCSNGSRLPQFPRRFSFLKWHYSRYSLYVHITADLQTLSEEKKPRQKPTTIRIHEKSSKQRSEHQRRTRSLMTCSLAMASEKTSVVSFRTR